MGGMSGGGVGGAGDSGRDGDGGDGDRRGEGSYFFYEKFIIFLVAYKETCLSFFRCLFVCFSISLLILILYSLCLAVYLSI